MKKNLHYKFFDYDIIDFFGFNIGLTEIKKFTLTDEIKALLLIQDLDTATYQSSRHFEFYTEESGLYFIICRDLRIEKIFKT